jgi:hypothetical protein
VALSNAPGGFIPAITVTQISHNFQQDRQLINRVLKNKHQAVSQGRYELEARGLRLAKKTGTVSQASISQLPADSMQAFTIAA